jgi:hypothetical protein
VPGIKKSRGETTKPMRRKGRLPGNLSCENQYLELPGTQNLPKNQLLKKQTP